MVKKSGKKPQIKSGVRRMKKQLDASFVRTHFIAILSLLDESRRNDNGDFIYESCSYDFAQQQLLSAIAGWSSPEVGDIDNAVGFLLQEQEAEGKLPALNLSLIKRVRRLLDELKTDPLLFDWRY